MDQERDTIGNQKSSRNGRFWLEKGPADAPAPEPKPASEMMPNQPPNAAANSQNAEDMPKKRTSVDSNSVAPRSMDSDHDALPTLFELPDRTPEALLRERETTEVTFHSAHAGPPASHVDPPSGNQSHLEAPGPTSPFDFDSAIPASDSHVSKLNPAASSLPVADQPTGDQKLAAYRDDHPEWTENSKLSWGTRSAVIILMLLMVTLAFFSGRGIQRFGQPDQASAIAQAEQDELANTVIMITEDVEIVEDPLADVPGSTDLAQADATGSVDDAGETQAERTSREIMAEIANLPPQPNDFSDANFAAAAAVAVEKEPIPNAALNDVPSYVAETGPTNATPANSGVLGQPSVATPQVDAVAGNSLPAQPDSNAALDQPADFPAIAGTTDSVVAFRTNEIADGESTDTADDLPAGMDDRLRLEDGLRYSDTPHSLGDLLEILTAWENAELR